jgi:hypothetical protein
LDLRDPIRSTKDTKGPIGLETDWPFFFADRALSLCPPASLAPHPYGAATHFSLCYSLRPPGAKSTMKTNFKVLLAASIAAFFLVASHAAAQAQTAKPESTKKDAPAKRIAIRAVA